MTVFLSALVLLFHPFANFELTRKSPIIYRLSRLFLRLSRFANYAKGTIPRYFTFCHFLFSHTCFAKNAKAIIFTI